MVASSILFANPKIAEEIIKMGGKSLLECYQCGSCTAVCPITESIDVSFRRAIRYTQIGLNEKILGDITPWTCNLHGDCTDSCPRGASPSEVLAAIRRYQSGFFDPFGVSRWWNKTKLFEKLILYFVVFVISLSFYYFYYWNSLTGYISTEFFAVKDLSYPIAFSALFASLILFLSAKRAYRAFGGGKEYKVGFLSSIIKLTKFFIEVEKDALKVPEKRDRIIEHVFILLGLGFYTLILLFYLFSPSYFFIYPYGMILKFLGYFAAISLLYGFSSPLMKRLFARQKTHWYYKKFTHSTDWMSLIAFFPVALLYLAILILNDISYYYFSYILYIVVLSLIVPILLLEVPFGKHNHWLYKVLAYYIAARKGFFKEG
ncbi:MAG: 4Fe-4S dicluster domain-containing protein [Archaeoglobales archaeon]|nr:4Fe-4S dicluster domain-containing protein [Archaeoglobales archaeon]